MSRIRATIAVLLAAAGLWFSVPAGGLPAVGAALTTTSPLPLPLAVLGLLGAFGGRVLRFQLLLGSQRPPIRHQIAASGIGFFALQALPFRLGEFVRPHLLATFGVPWGASLGALAVERFFDLLTLLGMLGLVGLLELPILQVNGIDALAAAQTVALTAVAIGLGAGIALIAFGPRMTPWLHRLPLVGPPAARIAHHATGTLASLSARTGVAALALSGVIWTCNVGTVWATLNAFAGLPANPGVALSVCTATIAGVLAVPTPGMVGSFEWFATATLGLWGAPEAPAAAMAMLWHTLVVGLHALLGAGLLVVHGLSLGDVVRSSRSPHPTTDPGAPK